MSEFFETCDQCGCEFENKEQLRTHKKEFCMLLHKKDIKTIEQSPQTNWNIIKNYAKNKKDNIKINDLTNKNEEERITEINEELEEIENGLDVSENEVFSEEMEEEEIEVRLNEIEMRLNLRRNQGDTSGRVSTSSTPSVSCSPSYRNRQNNLMMMPIQGGLANYCYPYGGYWNGGLNGMMMMQGCGGGGMGCNCGRQHCCCGGGGNKEDQSSNKLMCSLIKELFSSKKKKESKKFYCMKKKLDILNEKLDDMNYSAQMERNNVGLPNIVQGGGIIGGGNGGGLIGQEQTAKLFKMVMDQMNQTEVLLKKHEIENAKIQRNIERMNEKK